MKAADFGDLSRRKTAVIGRPGTGKTTLLGNIARSQPKVLIVDPVGPLARFADLRIPIRAAPTPDAIAGALRRIASECWPAGQRVALDASAIFGDERAQLGDLLGRAAIQHLRGGVVILDEAHWFMPQGSFSTHKGLFELIGKGRNYGLGTVVSTHRPAMVEKNALELSDLWIIMGLTGTNDLKAVARLLENSGIACDSPRLRQTVAALGLGDFVLWDANLNLPRPPSAPS